MQKTLQRLAFIALTLASVSVTKALTVFNYTGNEVNYERFGGSFPSAPTINPLFFLSNYDLSGIGWNTGNFGMTLISPQHFLTAAHVAPANGSTINFLSTDGVLRTYTVASTYTVQHSAGVSTDLVVGRLTAPIQATDHVNFFPTLVLNSSTNYLGLTMAVFGSGQRAGTNTIDVIGNADLLPFGSPDGFTDNSLIVTDFDSVSGQTQAQSGDSGSPSFIDVNGTLALVGTHSAINSNSPPQTFDVFIPAYYTQINNQLGADGYSFGAFTAVPEPASWGIAFGAIALGAGYYRRRRCNG